FVEAAWPLIEDDPHAARRSLTARDSQAVVSPAEVPLSSIKEAESRFAASRAAKGRVQIPPGGKGQFRRSRPKHTRIGAFPAMPPNAGRDYRFTTVFGR